MQLKDESRREQAKGQAPDMQRTIDRLLAQQRYVEELEQKVQRLEMENQRLRDHGIRLDDLFENHPRRNRDRDEPELGGVDDLSSLLLQRRHLPFDPDKARIQLQPYRRHPADGG